MPSIEYAISPLEVTATNLPSPQAKNARENIIIKTIEKFLLIIESGEWRVESGEWRVESRFLSLSSCASFVKFGYFHKFCSLLTYFFIHTDN